MKHWGRIALAVALPIGLVAISSTQALANGRSGPVTATGSVTCATVTGQVAFSPPLRVEGTSNNENIKFTLRLSGCTTTGSNVSGVTSGWLKITMTTPVTTNDRANACSVLILGNVAASATVKWKAPAGTRVNQSTLSTSGETWGPYQDPLMVSLPGGGSASNSGTSFSGGDSGAGSTISLTFNPDVDAFHICSWPGKGSLPRYGVPRAYITSGSVTLG